MEDDIRKAEYFKEISDKIDKEKDIDYIQGWTEFEQNLSSPFYYYIPSEPVKTSVNEPNNAQPKVLPLLQ